MHTAHSSVFGVIPVQRLVLFCLAALAPALAIAAPPRFTTDIPFRDCDGLICVEVNLDGGKTRSLMLDTGNDHSTVISDVARELGWTLEPLQRDGRPVQGIFKAGEHRSALGRAEGRETYFAFDRDLLGEHKPPVDGSITLGFFANRVLQIDYPKHRLRVSDVIGAVPERAEGSGSLKMIGFGDRGAPVLTGSPFSIDGKPFRAQIDTVFTGTLLVYDSALHRLDLHKQGTPAFFGYTDGGVSLLGAAAPDIAFGQRVFAKGAMLYFVGEGASPVRQPDGLFDAKAGNALFAHSIVTLDLHAMTMDVKPSE